MRLVSFSAYVHSDHQVVTVNCSRWLSHVDNLWIKLGIYLNLEDYYCENTSPRFSPVNTVIQFLQEVTNREAPVFLKCFRVSGRKYTGWVLCVYIALIILILWFISQRSWCQSDNPCARYSGSLSPSLPGAGCHVVQRSPESCRYHSSVQDVQQHGPTSCGAGEDGVSLYPLCSLIKVQLTGIFSSFSSIDQSACLSGPVHAVTV